MIISILQSTDDDDIDQEALYSRYQICCQNCEPKVDLKLQQVHKIYSKPVPKLNIRHSVTNKSIDYLYFAYLLMMVSVFGNQILSLLAYQNLYTTTIQDLLLIPGCLFLLKPRPSVFKTPKLDVVALWKVLAMIISRILMPNFGLLIIVIAEGFTSHESKIRTGIIKYEQQSRSPQKAPSPKQVPDKLLDKLSFSNIDEDDGIKTRKNTEFINTQAQTTDWNAKPRFNPPRKWNSPFSSNLFTPQITFGHTPNSLKWITKQSPSPSFKKEPELNEMRFKPQKFPSMVQTINRTIRGWNPCLNPKLISKKKQH